MFVKNFGSFTFRSLLGTMEEERLDSWDIDVGLCSSGALVHAQFMPTLEVC